MQSSVIFFLLPLLFPEAAFWNTLARAVSLCAGLVAAKMILEH